MMFNATPEYGPLHCINGVFDARFIFFAYWVLSHAFLSFAVCFFRVNIKKTNRNTIRLSNSLNPDQTRHFVGPDLGPNCLQKLSTDDTSRQRAKKPGITGL